MIRINNSSIVFLFLLVLSQIALAQTPPGGFASATVSTGWNEAVGLTFSKDGSKMFVWERGGRVWVVINNQKQLFLDLTEEVGGWHDHGLLGFALDPNFDANGHFYLLYLVDRHHLMNYGTGAYNAFQNDFFKATIGRVTRYTATANGNGFTVNPSSRKILIGATKTTGIPSLSITHVTGSLVFGTDNTLLIATGDGGDPTPIDVGSTSTSYYEQALTDGIITPQENIGAYRSQLLSCLNGKILRIDPETGLGIPSNPFYDPANPNATKSKVFALGLRNPFRMSLKPGTGSHNSSDGNPGVLYIGDVGWNTWEEINVMDKPAMNFGWPAFEGLEVHTGYFNSLTPNYSAPNPLYQVNGCNQQYFYFQNLIKQETASGTATFTNPCNPSQSIPSSIPTFEHSRPIIDWRHGAGPSRTATFNGETATVANIGAAGSPVSGPQFGGNSSTGGVFYTGTDFPAPYQGSYFFGDYATSWMRNMSVDDQDHPVAVRNFINNGAVVVSMATNPASGGLYYVNFGGEIRRVYYSSNQPPVAAASVNITYGPSPLNVQFTGSGSIDPEGQPLNYEWNFGDGTPVSTTANPSHSFTAAPGVPTKYTVTLKVTDSQGDQNQTTLIVSVNNTPPDVEITSPAVGTLYPLTGETTFVLEANVTDDEHNANQLTYVWQTTLYHGNHMHPEPIDNSPSTTTSTSPLGCGTESYHYQIVLTVTDAAGASTSKEVILNPDCSSLPKVTPIITWSNPSSITTGTALSSTQLNATAMANGNIVAGTFTYTPGAGTILPEGLGQQLSVSFTPSNPTLYNTATRSVTIDVMAPGTVSFYRGINLNGAALTIDGNNWQASTTAPNFTYTTNRTVFANQGVTLIPPTDANRSTMIRSSIYGENIALAVGAVPAGIYQIWLYVWEDNNAEVYSISVEGSVVQPNYNSGPAGTWRRLGPFQANITDGAINVSATGGSANFSGLEIWSVGPGGGNQPPIVSNAIADQITTVGTSFNYTFPTNTFTDPNAGTVLSYTSILSGGSPLPAWLSFNAATRTFTGTPLAANVGTLDIQVTASDGAGGSVSDVFSLTTNAAGTASFYRAINLNGAALTIDGNNWQASTAPNFAYTTNQTVFANQGVTLIPSTDTNRATMIRSSIYGENMTVAVSAVPAGTYRVWLYVWEDNNAEVYTLSLEGSVVQANHNSGPAGTWNKLGPFEASITDGTINISSVGGAANLSGLEIWSVGAGGSNQPPVVANALVDQSVDAGSALSYTFAANTFTDPNAGTILSYAATLSGGGALPGWLTFNGGTRTFSGTPLAANVGALDVQVTASDGAGGSVSDVFALTVNSVVQVTPLITWANPASISAGIALSSTQLNATASYNGTPVGGVFTYSPVSGTVLDEGAGQELSVSFAPTNTTLYTTATKSVMIDVTEAIKVTPLITWPNPVSITSGTALSSTQLNATASYNGSPVGGTFTYTPVAGTILGEGLGQPLSVSFAPTNTILYNTATQTVNIDVLPQPTSSFYRGINLNGAAMVIDGNNWISSTGAPNFSFTNNIGVVNSQGATLIPSTDANRATMIKSSIWGKAVNLAVSGVPAGSYQVWLYVWEDNAAQTFSVSIEGTVAQSNYNSGPAGTWRKLGPFQTIISDGTINVSTSGGDANLSGLEIWSVGQGGGNQPPVVANAIPDQTATEGLAFSYTFPTNTFSDPNIGTVLTYSASLSGGGALPAWLSFSGGTRTFSGTPGAAGPVDVQVTASDGAGGSISDVFRITVNSITKVTPLISWATPSPITVGTALSSTQLNATASYNGSPVPGTFAYTPVSGTVLGVGTGQQLSVSFTPTNTTLFNPAGGTVFINVVDAGSSTFYRAINLNGPALLIDGNNWVSSTGAANFSFANSWGAFSSPGITLIPSTDTNRGTMIRSSIWGRGLNVSVSSVPAGTYVVWLYVWEDNGPQTFSVLLEGTIVQSNYNSGSTGTWRKLGPFQATISDGTINVSATGGDANFSGIEIWNVNQSAGGREGFVSNTETFMVEEEPKEFSLTAYPNPFSGKVSISFTASESAATQLAMYDSKGVRMQTLFEGNVSAGHQEELELEVDIPDGVYVLQLINGRHIQHLRLAMTR